MSDSLAQGGREGEREEGREGGLTEVLLGVRMEGDSNDVGLAGVGLGVPEVQVEAFAGGDLREGGREGGGGGGGGGGEGGGKEGGSQRLEWVESRKKEDERTGEVGRAWRGRSI